MQLPKRSHDILTLNEVKNRFSQWKETRKKHSRIPEALWDDVKWLIGRYPLSEVSHVLGIRPKTIETRLGSSANLTFVEARLASSQSSKDLPLEVQFPIKKEVYSIELHRPCGGVLKINELPASLLTNIVSQFMR